MLALYRRDGAAVPDADLAAAALPPEIVWVDLLNANAEEIAFVERAMRLQLPDFDDLSEIEASSRLYVENGILFLSAPLLYRRPVERAEPTPVGFIVTPERLVTVRFRALPAFETFG